MNMNKACAVCAAFAVMGGVVLAAQDKYSVQVPNGLAFSDFRGYEDWEVVSTFSDTRPAEGDGC